MRRARNCGGAYRSIEEGPPVIVLGKDKGKIKGAIVLRECPLSYIDDWSFEMIHLFNFCHAVVPSLGRPSIVPGFPPSHGGVLDQDNATMEAFEVIKNEIMAIWEEGKK
jgi:hypothetical protein